MKKIYQLSVLLIFACICLSASCKKNGADPNSSQLPEATQTGANTFGCRINGQVFVPKNDFFNGHSPYQCNYIYTNGGYNFFVTGSDNSAGSDYIYKVALATVLLPIKEGQTFKLENYNENGKACAVYQIISVNIIRYQTTTIVNGQLHISKLDTVKQIVSGTFNFNAIRTDISKSDTIHVTDGRFDMKYTQ